MLNKKLTRVALISALVLSTLGLSACDRVKDIVATDGSTSNTTATQQATNNDGKVTRGSLFSQINNKYGPTGYLNLEPSLQLPDVVKGTNVDKITNYDLLSTIYKNYLYNIGEYYKSEKATNLLNELYYTINTIGNVPNSQILIFYIDAVRKYQASIQNALNTLSVAAGISKTLNVGNFNEQQRIQFLTKLTEQQDQATNNFFAMHQFLGKRDIGLDSDAYISEYERYNHFIKELKNLNVALIQYDTTCTTRYQTAGYVINCLQQKYGVAIAGIDTQLLNVFHNYLIEGKDANTENSKQNLATLKANLTNVIQHYKTEFANYTLQLDPITEPVPVNNDKVFQ